MPSHHNASLGPCPWTDEHECMRGLALDADGSVFRFMTSSPPSTGDLQTHVQRWPGKWVGDQLCKGSGLSVFVCIEEAMRVRARAKRFRNKHIYRGHVTWRDGKMLCTPVDFSNLHHTLWLMESVAPSGIFITRAG